MSCSVQTFVTSAMLCLCWMLSSSAVASLAPQTDEELRIWNRSDEERAILERSGFLIEDPALAAYLDRIVARLAHADGLDADSFYVRVVRDPTLNAFAFPTGHLFIHSGLLARMLNEAQCAAVLSHEMTHATNRHAWKQFRSLKTKTAWLSAATVSAGDYSSLVQLLGGIGTLAAVTGYSRAMETEADTGGWKRMVAAGYDTSEASAVFRLLMADLKDHERKEPFFFGTHPRLADREANFDRLNAQRSATTTAEQGAERYVENTLVVLLINGELEMRAGRVEAARDQLWRYRAARPSDVRVRWLLGENERLAGEKGNVSDARRLLEEAIQMDETFAPAHRSLGILLYRAGDLARAAVHLRLCLDLDPTINDRAYLESFLEKCESNSAVTTEPAS